MAASSELAASMGRSRQVVRGAARPRQTFGEVVRDLLIERDIVTAIGNPDWPKFVQTVEGLQYESLRKAVTGERPPSIKIMETVAEALGVEPTVFWEYQLAQVQRSFDPKEVGEDEAFANLQKWLGKNS